MNRCATAYLVGVGAGAGDSAWLPAEPETYNWGSSRPIIGCNRLRCPACGEAVRYEPDPSGRCRRYACRCAAWSETTHSPTEQPADAWVQRPSWACDGHPLLALPATIDGIAVQADMDFWALAALALPAYWPAPLPPLAGDAVRGLWLVRLYHLMQDAEARHNLGRGVAAQLTAEDPAVRAGALRFFADNPRAAGAEELAGVAMRDRALFAGRPDPDVPGATLQDLLLRALRARGRLEDRTGHHLDPAAVAALAEAAPPRQDPEW